MELDDLATSLDGLESWTVAERFLRARQAGHENANWKRHERALGTLPPGGLGDDSLLEIKRTVDAMLELTRDLGVDLARDDRVQIDVELREGTRVVGTVAVRSPEPSPGPVLVTYSKVSPKQHLAAWLDLVALVATDPARRWRSVVVRRTEAGEARRLVLVARGKTVKIVATLHATPSRSPSTATGGGFASPSRFSPACPPSSTRAPRNPTTGRTAPGSARVRTRRTGWHSVISTSMRFAPFPARPDDPPGTSLFRAQRFAGYLWDAIDESTEELT